MTGQRGLHHIGYWVDDLEVAMWQARSLLSVGPFTVLEHIDLGDFAFRGGPGVLDHSAAFAAWGPVLLELGQVHEVTPELGEALGVRHGAVSHVAWVTDDLAAEDLHMTENGCPVLTTSIGGAVANWYEAGGFFGHPIEVHQPPEQVQAFWNSLR